MFDIDRSIVRHFWNTHALIPGADMIPWDHIVGNIDHAQNLSSMLNNYRPVRCTLSHPCYMYILYMVGCAVMLYHHRESPYLQTYSLKLKNAFIQKLININKNSSIFELKLMFAILAYIKPYKKNSLCICAKFFEYDSQLKIYETDEITHDEIYHQL